MRKLLGVICVASLCLGPAQAQNGTSTSPQGAAGIYPAVLFARPADIPLLHA
jgi:hypothetical protein